MTMTDMWDAVDWQTLQGRAGVKAGYVDGPVSEWPAEAWAAFQHDQVIRISVLAAPGADAYDGETGNAGPEQVASVISGEVASGRRPWLYANEDQLGEYLSALAGKSVRPTDRSEWPRPGVYLWLADPSGNLAAGRWQPPVDPVAVQDRQEGTVDHSTLYVALDGPTPAPEPAPQPVPVPAPEVINVLVPQLQEGSTGEPVRALQTLVGGLAVDGVFGPLTREAVVRYQAAHQLAQDGIVGVHTWGSLLGHPQ